MTQSSESLLGPSCKTICEMVFEIHITGTTGQVDL
jgi:hypothetical protein